MIKAVIYDSDGMITHGPRFSSVYSDKYNIPIEEMLPFFKGPFNECLVGKIDLREELQKGWLEKWKWAGTVDEFLAYWFSVGDDIDKNVIQTVVPIKSQGIRCVLATNNEKRRTDHLVDKFNYRDIFDTVYSSGYVGYKKPSREFFEYVFQDLKKTDSELEKVNILFWDDDIENIEGAKAFGFQVELFTSLDYYKERMKAFNINM